MFKARELVSFCKSLIGMPYWYGTCVYKCTEDLLNRKSKQYAPPKYSHYVSSRTSRYRSDIKAKKVCTDCVGMIKGFFWTNGGEGVLEAIGTSKSIQSRYCYNGCPDKSADGLYKWCVEQGAKHGPISTLPPVPGVLVFSPGHVGVSEGNGYTVEARAFKYGVVETANHTRSWQKWAYLPDFLLDYETDDETTVPSIALGSRMLEKNMIGPDVAELQALLVKLGYDLGSYGKNADGVDGEYGKLTVEAVKDFQAKYNLEVDGQYGKLSHAKMLEVISSLEPQPFMIEVTGFTVNVRKSPDPINGQIVKVVSLGEKLEATGVDKETGWYILTDGNYITPKYVKEIQE